MLLADFLAWEERQERPWEFNGVASVKVPDVTVRHDMIQSNMTCAVHARLRGTSCGFYGPLLKISVAGSVRYPDGFVSCALVVANDQVMPDPVVILEILRDSTDRIVRVREYHATPSVQRYVLLEEGVIAATVHTRDGDRWIVTLLAEGDTLDMPGIGIAVPLAEFYEDVPLDPPDA